MNVIFPVEIPNRELMYKSILGDELAENGYTCYLALKKHIPFLIEKLSPCIYFDKGYHPGVSEKIHDLVRKGKGVICGLDEEGAVDYEDFSTLSSRYSDYVFSAYDLVFMWGERQYQFFSSCRPSFDPKKVFVTGHPRFEYLKKYSGALYGEIAADLKKRYGEYVLINLNAGFGNNIKGDDFVRSNYSGRVKSLDQVIVYDKVKIKAYCDLIKTILRTTSYTIILRPHPEENVETYTEHLLPFLKEGRCVVSTKHSVIPWLLAAKKIIHPDCTTGAEAKMLGGNPISYLPKSEHIRYTYVPVAVSEQASDSEKVLSLLLDENDMNLRQTTDILDSFFQTHISCSTLIRKMLTDLYPSRKKRELSLLDCSLLQIKKILRDKFGKFSLLEQQKNTGFGREAVANFIRLKSGDELSLARLKVYAGGEIVVIYPKE